MNEKDTEMMLMGVKEFCFQMNVANTAVVMQMMSEENRRAFLDKLKEAPARTSNPFANFLYTDLVSALEEHFPQKS